MLLGKERIPLYYQLAEIIINEIENKGLQENDRIPAEREYCEKYKLSRATVRQAIDYLEKRDISTRYREVELLFQLGD